VSGGVTEKEVVGVQPREVEEQRFEMEKVVCVCCDDKVLWYAFSLLYLFPTLDFVTFLREFEKGHFQITNTTCIIITLLPPTQHNTLKSSSILPFNSHFVYYVNPYIRLNHIINSPFILF